ncbi:MAG: hypothetical protein GF329_12635 [Candidatus Lokiarchaeota archaeon]|nr:hypothetical protein [Candidatus Lokiarchaeota archaeon]
MSSELPFVGYGTFIYKLKKYKPHIEVLGVCRVQNYVRIYHKKLAYWYPFVLFRKNHEFKGLLFKVLASNFLYELDRYEGVPELYERVKCEVKFNSQIMKCWIYVPSIPTINKIQKEIKKFNSIEKEEIFRRDLWLEYLKSKYPRIIKEYPKLFTPIEKQ